MEEILLVLAGFMVGGALVRFLMIRAAQRHLRPNELDPEYMPAVRAVMRHVKTHGTINLEQVKQLLSIKGVVAMRYLEQMVRSGLLKAHHSKVDGGGTLYTRG